MKLYATTTSERASKGQGGNKYLEIAIQVGDNREELAKIKVIPEVQEYDGVEYLSYNMYINGEFFQSRIQQKGKKQ